MDRTEVIERLLHFGLSRQEAQLYFCLWEHGRLTGYEASKLTGISRSNAYGALNVLTDKGAAIVMEGSTTLYSAVEPEEFLNNRLRRLEQYRTYILEHLPQNTQEAEGYLTIQGSRNIQDKIYNMIDHCTMRLYMAAPGAVIREFEEVLERACQRQIKTVLISDEDCSRLSERFYQDNIEPGQIRLITDSSYVLTGEYFGKNSDTCLYSGQANLVTIMKEALRNQIRLLELGKEIG